MLFYLLIALVVVLDQVMKYYIRTNMQVTESVPLWEGVINLTSHRNTGAAFGIMEGQQWFFILSVVAVIVGVIYFRAKGEFKGRPLMETGVALLVGGAIGNAIDRVVFGAVTDFFDLQFTKFAIFNIADIAINLGVGLMILSMLLEWVRTSKKVSRKGDA
ncbi:signal peptidase II [Tumebacillus sp. BK434]|uniref:signal peptidase II n=1 Tax=Tumebacillus sp. BK434 TaxID=2512169 RepID=UPI0010F0C569|nr:signal peptidase II [Tumebacillus sp. BK434]TCP52409.1 signal peptidase II [Tumebacillus sp. BK434]